MYTSAITLPNGITSGLYTLTALCSLEGCEQTAAVQVISSNSTPAPTGNVFVAFSEKARPGNGEVWLTSTQAQARIHLNKGATIDYFAKNGMESVINDYLTDNAVRPQDVGRQKGCAIYSGPGGSLQGQAFCKDGQCTSDNGRGNNNIGYNDVQNGDEARYPSPVVAYGESVVPGYGRMVYTKTKPNQWHLVNVQGYSYIEQWVWMQGDVVRSHYKITFDRPETTQWEARSQEFSFIYLTSKYRQFYAPLPGGITNITSRISGDGFDKSATIITTKPWVAAVNQETGIAVGMVSLKGYCQLAAKYGGEAGAGPKANAYSYVAHIPPLIMDNNLVYEYDDAILIGTLADIQTYSDSLTLPDPRPHYVFNTSRRDFYYLKGIDTGYISPGRLVVTPNNKQFEVNSQIRTFLASQVSNLYIKLKYTGSQTQLALRWRKAGQSELDAEQLAQKIVFNVQSGIQQEYVINVGNNAKWTGDIAQLKLSWVNQVDQALTGESWEIWGISYLPSSSW